MVCMLRSSESGLTDRTFVVVAHCREQGDTVYCGKKVLTSRISGPDKYRQVVLGVRRGVHIWSYGELL